MQQFVSWRQWLTEAVSLRARNSTETEGCLRQALMLAENSHGIDSLEAGIVLVEFEDYLEFERRYTEAYATRLRLRSILRQAQAALQHTPDLAQIRRQNQAVGTAITVFRCSQSVTIENLASKSSIGIDRLTAMEAGRSSIRLTELSQIAWALEIAPGHLMNVAETIFYCWSDESADGFSRELRRQAWQQQIHKFGWHP